MDFWVMRPFNGLFFAVFAACIAVLVVASLVLRNRSEALRRRVIIVASLICLAFAAVAVNAFVQANFIA